MAFELEWTEQAKEDFKNLERETAVRIIKKVEAIKSEPYRFLKKLVGEIYWKLRVEDYRVLFRIDYERNKLCVVKVGHRKNIYKG